MQVAHPETEVIGVPRDPARLLLALVDRDRTDAETAKGDGC